MSKKNHKIGIDARFLGEAGPGRYVKNIIENLEKLDESGREYIIYLRPKGFEQFQSTSERFKKVLADYKWYSWEEQFAFLFKILKDGLDIFYVPHFNIPILYTGKLVTAIPDIIMHSFSTERGTTLPLFYFRIKKWVYRIVVWWAVKRSYRVIVPSLDVMSDFRKAYPKAPTDKFVLAYEGVDPVFTLGIDSDNKFFDEFGIKKPYLLYVSSMYEHKNVPFLIDAFAEFIKNNKCQLVLVGKKDKFSESIYRVVVEKKLTESVLMPGMGRYITDKEITALRKNAAAYVFPSLKEGFSLTPLESQAVGLPCLISDIACHKEIYNDTVLYFDPNEKKDLLNKLNIITSDSTIRQKLISLGYENVKKYDWKNTAEITLRVFRDLLNNC
jgi:glycosyltransferase involved in cell wall biosynthesis